MGRKLRARSVAIAGSLMCNQRELIYDRMLTNDVRRKEDGENTHWVFAAVPKS
jgi:hypothetical protein